MPGLRYLSAHLRARGHTTELIMLPWNYTDPALSTPNSFRYPFPEDVMRQVADRCVSADLVGLSLMTCHFDHAVRLTRFLRRTVKAPVIWGGIHPTIRPEECLQHADLVCVGEGENSFAQLLDRMAEGVPAASAAVQGIYSRERPPAAGLPPAPSPIVEDLDALPLPDYQLEHHRVLVEGRLVQPDGPMMSRLLSQGYQAMFSRGCPYACTYCCNNALRAIHGRKLPVRWRSVSHRIAELEYALKLMPDLRTIGLADDAFLAQPDGQLREFLEAYRSRIGLPFSLLTTPRSVTDEKIEALAEAGLYHIGIGIQSGSPRIFKGMYHRPESLDSMVGASRCIERAARKKGKQVLSRYDFILDNPWESEEDLEQSIRLCLDLARPYSLAMFSLTLYPGTELYQKGRDEGLIADELNQVYRASQLVPKRTYMNGVFAAVSANAPRWAIRALLWKPLRRRPFLRSLPYRVAFVFEFLKLGRGFLGFLFRGDWKVIRFLFLHGFAKWKAVLKPVRHTVSRPVFTGAAGEA